MSSFRRPPCRSPRPSWFGEPRPMKRSRTPCPFRSPCSCPRFLTPRSRTTDFGGPAQASHDLFSMLAHSAGEGGPSPCQTMPATWKRVPMSTMLRTLRLAPAMSFTMNVSMAISSLNLYSEGSFVAGAGAGTRVFSQTGHLKWSSAAIAFGSAPAARSRRFIGEEEACPVMLCSRRRATR